MTEDEGKMYEIMKKYIEEEWENGPLNEKGFKQIENNLFKYYHRYYRVLTPQEHEEKLNKLINEYVESEILKNLQESCWEFFNREKFINSLDGLALKIIVRHMDKSFEEHESHYFWLE